jgi:putative membrane protein
VTNRGHRLEDVGSDPDPRFSLANERTFLAWSRTALALIAAGLAVAQFLDVGGATGAAILAIPLVVLGGAIAGLGYHRWQLNERALRLDEPLGYSILPLLLAVALGVMAAVALVIVVVDGVG